MTPLPLTPPAPQMMEACAKYDASLAKCEKCPHRDKHEWSRKHCESHADCPACTPVAPPTEQCTCSWTDAAGADHDYSKLCPLHGLAATPPALHSCDNCANNDEGTGCDLGECVDYGLWRHIPVAPPTERPEYRSCTTCWHGDRDGCNHVDATAETCSSPTLRLYQRRGVCTCSPAELNAECPVHRSGGAPPVERHKAPVVVCLCGSTRFAEAFTTAARNETLVGKIVLSVGLFGHVEGLDMTSDTKKMLDELHLRKIDLADEVLILNVGDYIGESTRRELDYARKHGKAIRFLEPSKVAGYPKVVCQKEPITAASVLGAAPPVERIVTPTPEELISREMRLITELIGWSQGVGTKRWCTAAERVIAKLQRDLTAIEIENLRLGIEITGLHNNLADCRAHAGDFAADCERLTREKSILGDGMNAALVRAKEAEQQRDEWKLAHERLVIHANREDEALRAELGKAEQQNAALKDEIKNLTEYYGQRLRAAELERDCRIMGDQIMSVIRPTWPNSVIDAARKYEKGGAG